MDHTYTAHFGLRAEPFGLTPDPSSLYLTPGHAEAFAALDVGLRNRSGLIVLTGEPGIGKTTLVYAILSRLGPEVRTAYVSNTSLSFDEILQQILADLGVPGGPVGRLELLHALNTFLMACAAADTLVAVIIDEAQNLSRDALENVRLLSNYETFTAKLLQIVLVGQPELDAKLGTAGLRQVASRVAVRCTIRPLSADAARRYVEYRLQGVGGALDLFAPGALSILVREAGGIPRRINILCQNALLFAYGRGARRVSRATARAARRTHSIHRRAPERLSGRRSAPPHARARFVFTGWAALAVGTMALVLVAAAVVGGPVAAPNPPAHAAQAAARSFPTMLAVEVDFAGNAAALRAADSAPDVTTDEPIGFWIQLLLAIVTVAIAAISAAVLVRLRQTRSTGWGLT